MTNVTLVRRQNVLVLFQTYAGKAFAAGATAKGLEQSFAAVLEISPSMWSQIKASRPIGDKLARQIEAHCDQPAGWLDAVRPDATPTAAERAFLDLALQAWRATNGAGRKALRAQLMAVAAGGAALSFEAPPAVARGQRLQAEPATALESVTHT